LRTEGVLKVFRFVLKNSSSVFEITPSVFEPFEPVKGSKILFSSLSVSKSVWLFLRQPPSGGRSFSMDMRSLRGGRAAESSAVCVLVHGLDVAQFATKE
jgi:hypothetical protein